MLCLFEKTKKSKNTRKIKAFLVLFLAIMIVSFCAISSGASNVGTEEYYEYDAETGEETIFSLPAASLSTYARSSNETIEWDENGNIISRSTPPYDPDAAEGVSMKLTSKVTPLPEHKMPNINNAILEKLRYEKNILVIFVGFEHSTGLLCRKR